MSISTQDYGVEVGHLESFLSPIDLLPEVEIVSLVGEELPRYRLKVDYLTQFVGYGHADFAGAAEAVGGAVVDVPALSKPQEDRVIKVFFAQP